MPTARLPLATAVRRRLPRGGPPRPRPVSVEVSLIQAIEEFVRRKVGVGLTPLVATWSPGPGSSSSRPPTSSRTTICSSCDAVASPGRRPRSWKTCSSIWPNPPPHDRDRAGGVRLSSGRHGHADSRSSGRPTAGCPPKHHRPSAMRPERSVAEPGILGPSDRATVPGTAPVVGTSAPEDHGFIKYIYFIMIT